MPKPASTSQLPAGQEQCHRLPAISDSVTAEESRAGDAKAFVVADPDRGQLSTPDAAGICADGVLNVRNPVNRRPVSEDNRLPYLRTMIEPLLEARWCILDRSLGREIHRSVCSDETHPGQIVRDDSQSIHSRELLYPACRTIAVHVAKEIAVISSSHCRFDFVCITLGLLQ